MFLHADDFISVYLTVEVDGIVRTDVVSIDTETGVAMVYTADLQDTITVQFPPDKIHIYIIKPKS